MLLQPRNFVYNTNQNRSSTQPFVSQSLTYGDSGLFLFQPLSLSSNQIFSLNLFLNNAVNKSDYTNRSVWFAAFPHLPLTNNTNGMRMGNGTGKLSTWQVQIPGGKILLELNNLRFGSSLHFINQVAHNLTVNTNPVHSSSYSVSIKFSNSVNPHIRSYW